MSMTNSVTLQSYSSMKNKFKKIQVIFDFAFDSQNFAIFDNFYTTDHKT